MPFAPSNARNRAYPVNAHGQPGREDNPAFHVRWTDRCAATQ